MSDMPETRETEEPSSEEEIAETANEAEDVPEEDASNDDKSTAGAEADELGSEPEVLLKTPEERIAGLEAENESLNDRLLRALAETENIRRRSQRDKQDTARYAVANFARDMLAVADNLGRALGSVDEGARKENEVIENLLIGVEMTERELLAAMARIGVTRMEPSGTRFDPNVHEAMFEYDDPSQPAGTVGQVIEPGYMIHERPLRPAKVGITKGGPKADPALMSDAQEDTPADPPKDTVGATTYESTGGAPGGQVDEEL
jgi:molecular chaperone GrpE